MEIASDFRVLGIHNLRNIENKQTLNRSSQRSRNRKNRAAGMSYKTFHDLYKSTGQLLGTGSLASVQTFANSSNNKEYAVKIIEKRKLQSRSRVLKEIEILYLCQGQENILQLHEYFEDNDRFYLLFDKMLGGTLFESINRRGHVTEMEASKIVLSITRALEFLHSKGIAHRDLKLGNILCERKEDLLPIRLCDFDLASDVPLRIEPDLCSTPNLMSPVGTPIYMAPEVVKTCADKSLFYDKKCDLWSLGIILYIMLCGYPPFDGDCGCDCGLNRHIFCQDCRHMLFDSIQNDVYDFPEDEWSVISDSAKDLIQHLLVRDPEKRYSAKQVLHHPWLDCTPVSNPLVTSTMFPRNDNTNDIDSLTPTAFSITHMLNQYLITNEPLKLLKNDKTEKNESEENVCEQMF